MKPLTSEQLIGLLLAVLTLVVFAPAVGHDFVCFDDPMYVSDNEQVLAGLTWNGLRWAWTTSHAGYYQPITWLSLQLDAQLFGVAERQKIDPEIAPKAWGFHLSNILLHTVNVVLVFVVLRRLSGDIGRSAVVAALFAVHPLHVESVAWVTERKDVLSMFFGLLALWAYAAYVQRPGLWRYAAVLVSFTLGLLAKPMLVTLPCILLLLDFWPLRRLSLGPVRLFVEKLPLFAVAVAMGVVTIFTHYGVGGLAPLERSPLGMRVVNAVAAYVWYLVKTVWPTNLAPFYPYFSQDLTWWQVAAAAALLIAITILTLAAARHWPYLAVGWLWFAIGLVPVIGLLQAGDQAVADRFTYLPHVGLFILIVWGLADLLTARSTPAAVPVAAAVALCLGLAVGSWRQLGYWRDSITILDHALRATEANPAAHHALGLALAKQDQLVAAADHFAEAVRLDPGQPKAQLSLGQALLKLGRPAEAVIHYQEALRLYPCGPPAHFQLGLALVKVGRPQAALEQFAEAARLDPDHAMARFNSGTLLVQAGRFKEAAEQYRAALRRPSDLDPDWPRAAAASAWTLATDPDAQRRDGALAVELAEQACQAAANRDPRLLDVLASAYAEVGQFDRARAAAERAQAQAAEQAPALASEIQQRLDLYRRGQPYRAQQPVPPMER